MTTLDPLTFTEAILLADLLADRDRAPAYVVVQNGHPHLASSWCVGEGKPWSEAQVVYTATPTITPPIDVEYALVGW